MKLLILCVGRHEKRMGANLYLHLYVLCTNFVQIGSEFVVVSSTISDPSVIIPFGIAIDTALISVETIHQNACLTNSTVKHMHRKLNV